MRKILTFVFLILFASNACGDQILSRFPDAWNHGKDNPLKTISGHRLKIAGDPFVLYEDGRFRMWFTAVVYRKEVMGERKIIGVAYAESEDGMVWDDQWFKTDENDGLIKLIFEPTENGFDHWGIENVSVVKKPEGGYLMYYTADSPPNGKVYTIGLATSPDGIKWKRNGFKPVMDSRQETDWEKPIKKSGQWIGGIRSPSVFYDFGDKVYKMWYEAVGDHKGKFGHTIGYAISEDGIEWQRRDSPVFTTGGTGKNTISAAEQPHVIQHPNGGYQLFFAEWPYKKVSSVDERKLANSIGYAFSEDGLVWNINPYGLILEFEGENRDQNFANGPSALYYGDGIYLWYLNRRALTDNSSLVYLATTDLFIVDQP